MLIMAFSAIFMSIFIAVCPHQLRMQLGFSSQAKEIKVNQDLPPFLETMLLSQADELVIDDQNLKDYYGIECNDPALIEILDYTKQPKRSMMGTPWYTVLSNDDYKDEFAYTGAFHTERQKLIKDGKSGRYDDEGEMSEQDIRVKCEQSDLVNVLLNIACVPDEVVRQISSFEPGWQR